jgi:hypothetical protein
MWSVSVIHEGTVKLEVPAFTFSIPDRCFSYLHVPSRRFSSLYFSDQSGARLSSPLPHPPRCSFSAKCRSYFPAHPLGLSQSWERRQAPGGYVNICRV